MSPRSGTARNAFSGLERLWLMDVLDRVKKLIASGKAPRENPFSYGASRLYRKAPIRKQHGASLWNPLSAPSIPRRNPANRKARIKNIFQAFLFRTPEFALFRKICCNYPKKHEMSFCEGWENAQPFLLILKALQNGESDRRVVMFCYAHARKLRFFFPSP